MGMVNRGDELEEIDNVDESDLELWEVLAEKSCITPYTWSSTADSEPGFERK
jgi:hypothetical protein